MSEFFSKLNSASMVVNRMRVNIAVNLVRIDFANKAVNMCGEFARYHMM
jgi:hypothetical protein